MEDSRSNGYADGSDFDIIADWMSEGLETSTPPPTADVQNRAAPARGSVSSSESATPPNADDASQEVSHQAKRSRSEYQRNMDRSRRQRANDLLAAIHAELDAGRQLLSEGGEGKAGEAKVETALKTRKRKGTAESAPHKLALLEEALKNMRELRNELIRTRTAPAPPPIVSTSSIHISSLSPILNHVPISLTEPFIFKHLSAVVYLRDVATRRIIYCNPAFEKTFLFRAADLVGRTLAEYVPALLAANGLPPFLEELRACARVEKQADTILLSRQTDAVTSARKCVAGNGTIIPITCTYALVVEPSSGTPKFLFGMGHPLHFCHPVE